MIYNIKRFSSPQFPTCYIMVGLPGSGKSNYIKSHFIDYPIISRDTIREEMGFAKPGQKIRCSSRDESRVTQEQDFRLKNYIQEQVNFVIDNTNLKAEYIQPIVRKLKEANYNIVAIKMNTPVELCIQRRQGQIPQEVMLKLNGDLQNLNLGIFGFDKIINEKGF